MAGRRTPEQRQRGFVRKVGKSFEVMIYAGPDPVTGKDRYLSKSTMDERKVDEIRTELLAKVDRQRNAATNATLAYAIDAWMDVHDGAPSTLKTYRGYIERTIKPALGDVPIANITPRILEPWYARLRKCRDLCSGKPFIEHRTTDPHECRETRHRRKKDHDCATVGCKSIECKPHQCRPMADSTVLQIHAIITGTSKTAVRWEWIPANLAGNAKKPKQPSPEPNPPTTTEAAQLVAAAWEQDPAWGMFVWLTMMTGARRGELVNLRWRNVDFNDSILTLDRNYAGGVEKDTKTHQKRRISLDDTTAELLLAHRAVYQDRLDSLGLKPSDEAFMFSYAPDHGRRCDPSAITHRYRRMCTQLGIDSKLHAMRHYSATELIAAGVDIRTVAGRLGHGGGGTTTLRVYAAWHAKTDKLAAELLAGRMVHPTSKA